MTPAQRSYCMSRNRGADTKPEVKLRKALWRMGLRYRTKSRLLGKPDIVFPAKRVAVFVDGCFWHGCPEHFQQPRANATFWRDKLDRNRARDQEVNQALVTQGWFVIRVWEHEVRSDVTRLANMVREALVSHGTRPPTEGGGSG